MKCEIQWIDCNNVPTPDTNEAVGEAVFKDGRRFPSCEDHLKTLESRCSHHAPKGKRCSHPSSEPSNWKFEPFR